MSTINSEKSIDSIASLLRSLNGGSEVYGPQTLQDSAADFTTETLIETQRGVNSYINLFGAVFLGVFLGIVILYLIQNNNMENKFCSLFNKNGENNNISNNKLMGQTPSTSNPPEKKPSFLQKQNSSRRPRPRAPPRPEPTKLARHTVNEKEPVYGPENRNPAPQPKAPAKLMSSGAGLPAPRSGGSAITLSQASLNSRLSTHEVPAPPKLPSLAKATTVAETTGTTTFLSTNKQLIDAAQSDNLRSKMNQAQMGIVPVSDRVELPFQTRVQDRDMYANIIAKRTQEIRESGNALPFSMPQEFGMSQQGVPTNSSHLGSGLLLA